MKKILIVEDHKDIRKLLRMTLDKQGVADWIIDEVRIDSTGTPHTFRHPVRII